MNKIALISVSDKTDIDVLASELIENGYTIISTGGTATYLKDKGIKIIPISKFTKFEEILGGRVKTLHPVIHAGILAKTEKDIAKLGNKKYSLIDMVVVNLYPFEKAISKKNCSFSNAIENIDIGGPTLLRASAKNHQRVTVLTDPSDYSNVLNQIKNNGKVNSSTRLTLAKKVFSMVSNYDAMISTYLDKSIDNKTNLLQSRISINARELSELRYGENPHQKAKLYEVTNPQLAEFDYVQLSGKALSFNNLVDTESAFSCVEQFEEPSCVIVKHANPCGVATSKTSEDAYKYAYKTDPTSAFGGIITFNKKINHKLIDKIIKKQFVEVIAAPDFDKKSLDVIKKKPNIRLLKIKLKKNNHIIYETKLLRNKILIQEKDSKSLSKKELTVVTSKKPTRNQLEDMIFAFKISRYVKSNSIIIVKNNKTLAIGAGQMSRIDSTNIAYNKAKKENISLKGAVLASEAFFPFRDNVDLAKKIGISAIIQPGGSINDEKIIEVANNHKLSMCFSHTRVFKH
jgi:phosphoribosylaminoimidazolecarboxamide formyltransferase/IMP cyclohydrolase